MLVPFLVFAIAVSHGVQLISAIGQHMAAGNKAEQAARLSFRALAIPGLIALLSDGLGFITLNVIEIQVIQDLATAASVGVAVILLSIYCQSNLKHHLLLKFLAVLLMQNGRKWHLYLVLFVLLLVYIKGKH